MPRRPKSHWAPIQGCRHQASAGLEFDSGDRWFAGTELRWSDMQFEDDANRIELADYFTADVFIGWKVTDSLSATFALENIFDETIETRKTASGLTFVGAPRTLSASIRLEF